MNQKKTYLRQVRRALKTGRAAKNRIIQDLAADFDAALRDGKTESEAAELLGSPEELAHAFAPSPAQAARRKSRASCLGALLCLAAAVFFLLLARLSRLHTDGIPIGGANQATDIHVLGSTSEVFADLLPGAALLFVLLALLLGIAGLFFRFQNKKEADKR